ncbi:hypothetical protein WN982_00345 [Paraburkholderia sp. IMGN_8]|uniref:hypothetical protein n=1 Tax=Paraburkholderia sp. IMGN_8 TaxID=3136564 RepID=UPI0031015F39
MATRIVWNAPETAAAALAANLDSNGSAWCLVKVDQSNGAAFGNGPQYRTVRFAKGIDGAPDAWLDGGNGLDLRGAVTGWTFIE